MTSEDRIIPTPSEERRILGYLVALIRRGYQPLERTAYTFAVWRR